MTQFDTIKARALTKEEFDSVTPDDLIYISSNEWNVPILEPGHCIDNKYYRDNGFVTVKTIYGMELMLRIGAVYVADDDGEEFPAIRTSGVRVSSTLYFPDMTAKDACERMYKALRAEFGAGVIEVWNIRTSPVRDVTRDIYAVVRDKHRTDSDEIGIVEKSRRILGKEIRDGHERFLMNEMRKGEQITLEVCPPEETYTTKI